MAQLDRDIYLRNHVMGVLVSFSGKGLSYSNMGELADSITEAVMEGDQKWQEENFCEHEKRVSSSDENGHMVVQCGRCDLVLWHEKD